LAIRMMVLAVAAGAGLGAIARYLVDITVQRRTAATWPAGTFVVNVTGSLALGILVGVGLRHGLGDPVRAVIGTGVIGGYTTFSTFAHDSVRLIDDRSTRHAAMHMATNLVAGLAAATVGLLAAQAL
jgi:CrcB protein